MNKIMSVVEQLESAHHFFRSSNKPNLFLSASDAGKSSTDQNNTGAANVPQMFQPNGDTTGSVMQFNGTLPDSVTEKQRADFTDLLKQQQFYLQSGIGLVTAWMTDRYQRDPKSWANPQNWQEPLSFLPSGFYTPTAITQYQFQQSMKGVEVATSFLNTMVGWASGAGIVSAFGQFLTTIGDQIRAGTTSKNTTMDTYNLSLSYKPMLDPAGNWQLVSLAEYYFISFSESDKTVYSNCASAEVYNFDFKYQKGQLLLNWADLVSDVNKDAKSGLDTIIGQSNVDDVSKAKNFFGAKATPK
nr:hypothetical protein [Pseudomonas luteola]